MAQYRYLFADLLTNDIYAELPLTGVSFSQELNTAGAFSGHLMIGDPVLEAYPIDQATKPSRTALYVERDGTLVWGGVVWSRSYDSDSQTMTITGREFESYYENRLVLSTSGTYLSIPAGTDLFTAVNSIFYYVQYYYSPNSDIGLQLNYSAALGQNIPTPGFVVKNNEFRTVMDVVKQLSNMAKSSSSSVASGFDFNINVDYDTAGNIVKSLELLAHRGGTWSAGDPNAPMLEFPGNVVSYEWPEDGNSVATEVFAVGNSDINYQNYYLSSLTGLDYRNTAQLTDGAPLLQKVNSVQNQENPTIVEQLNIAYGLAHAKPVTVATITWDQVSDPQLGFFQTGDEFRIKIDDVRFPAGLDTVLRLSKFEVSVGEDGPERITASFVDPLAFT
jgi:hypothetical protein